MDAIIKINDTINGFVWGPVMLVLLVGTGLYLSIATGFLQFRKFGYAMKNTIGKVFHKAEAGHGEITPFQAVTTALLSRVAVAEFRMPSAFRPLSFWKAVRASAVFWEK